MSLTPKWPVLTEDDYRGLYGESGNLKHLWGLPSNYDKLGPAKKQEARLKVVEDHSTPERFTAAYDFFCHHYLQRDHTDFKTLERSLQFYRSKKPAALIHHMLIDFVRRYSYNLMAIPRYYGKSVVIGQALPLFLALTDPGIKILYIINSDSFVKSRFADLMLQLESNPLIQEDFGMQKPRRGGDSIWTKNELTLKNRSKIIGQAIGARVLGIHPDLAILDDCEQDPDDPTAGLKDSDRLAAQLDNYIFSTIMPALEPGAGIYIIGTLISKRNYIYHAAYANEDKWSFWSRGVWAALDEDTGSLLWKHKYDGETIDALRRSLGSKFSSNVMNRPGADSELVLFIDDDFNQYTIDGGCHPKDEDQPLKSQSIIRWNDMGITQAGDIELIPQQDVAGSFLHNMYRFITVDYARSKTAKSDYSVVMVMGRDTKKRIWVLDLWAGRLGLDKSSSGGILNEDVFINRIWAMASKWRIHTVSIEDLGAAQYLLARMQSDLAERMVKHKLALNVTRPKYVQNMPKHDRICNALEYRMIQNLLFLPANLRKIWPFSMMYAQIRDCTRDGSRLKHDDCVDALAQQHYIPGNQPSGTWDRKPAKVTPIDMLRRGIITDENGMPYAAQILPKYLSPDLAEAVGRMRKERDDDDDEDFDGQQNWVSLHGGL